MNIFVPQVRSFSGDVMPTFNMTFFDWTDYEYMRPSDKKQFSKKQGMQYFTYKYSDIVSAFVSFKVRCCLALKW